MSEGKMCAIYIFANYNIVGHIMSILKDDKHFVNGGNWHSTEFQNGCKNQVYY